MNIHPINETIYQLTNAIGMVSISEVHSVFIAEQLAELVLPRKQAGAAWVLGFTGELGVGKSTMIRAFIKYFGSDSEIPSPTFSLIQEYRDTISPIYHLDLFRLESPSELVALDIEDMCMQEKALIMCEWPMRGMMLYADIDFEIRILADEGSAHRRLVRAIPLTARAQALIAPHQSSARK